MHFIPSGHRSFHVSQGWIPPPSVASPIEDSLVVVISLSLVSTSFVDVDVGTAVAEELTTTVELPFDVSASDITCPPPHIEQATTMKKMWLSRIIAILWISPAWSLLKLYVRREMME